MAAVRTFITPKEIVWGRGSILHLEHIQGKKALIVSDETMTKLGNVARAEHYLEKAGLEVKVFDEVEPEPSIHTVMKIVERHKRFSPDVIVGLGGGSSIDAGKAFQIFFEHPHLTFEGVRYFGGPPKIAIPPLRKTILVAIPSTSGTAAEVSFGAIITDPTIPAKCTILSPELIPSIAILDPDLAESMPKSLQADTGLDAMTHAIEAYVNPLGNEVSRAFALEATMRLMKYLPTAYIQGDRDAKERVHYAASLAGCAFSNSGLGVAHVIAAQVGGKFHITHGRSCAIALPHTIRFNASVVGSLYAELARGIGYRGGDQSEAVDYLVQKVIEVKKQLEMPDSYREAGVPEDAYHAELGGFIEKSFGLPMMKCNPRQCTTKELEELYNACYYGTIT